MKNLIYLLLFLAVSCGKKTPESIEKAVYYWQQGSLDGTKLDSLEIQKVYYRLFEVDYNEIEGNFPYNKNRPSYYELEGLKIVPTIFIKNEIFKHNTEKTLDELADNIVFLINKYTVDRWDEKKAYAYDEIQIDCDWTESTKDKYFHLLKKIKELSKKKLSYTLRLYPYAYPNKMGVPPVDKAMLMCYNLIPPLSDPKRNSVLEVDELKKYLVNKEKYPLHLDIALPVFSWAILYHNNQFSQLMNVDKNDIVDFTKKLDDMWYEVTEDHSIGNSTYVKVGDRIKIEEVKPETLAKSLDLIRKYVPLDKQVTVSLFDFQSSTFNKYSDEEITAIYTRLLQH
jgi:hypothetical protein